MDHPISTPGSETDWVLRRAERQERQAARQAQIVPVPKAAAIPFEALIQSPNRRPWEKNSAKAEERPPRGALVQRNEQP